MSIGWKCLCPTLPSTEPEGRMFVFNNEKMKYTDINAHTHSVLGTECFADIFNINVCSLNWKNGIKAELCVLQNVFAISNDLYKNTIFQLLPTGWILIFLLAPTPREWGLKTCLKAQLIPSWPSAPAGMTHRQWLRHKGMARAHHQPFNSKVFCFNYVSYTANQCLLHKKSQILKCISLWNVSCIVTI